MIILLGGSSHVGKTFFAQKLLEYYHYPYVSLDHLKMGFIRTKRTTIGVEEDEKMREFLWPYAVEIIKTNIENDQNLILEGCYIPPDWKKSFEKEYLDKIKEIFLVMSPAYIENNFDKLTAYADCIEKRLDDRPDKERLIRCSRFFKGACINQNSYVVEIDTSFDIDKITQLLIKRVEIEGKRGEKTEEKRLFSV